MPPKEPAHGCPEHSGLVAMIDAQDARLAALEEAITDIRDRLLNRVPPLVTLALSALSGMVGILVTALVMVLSK